MKLMSFAKNAAVQHSLNNSEVYSALHTAGTKVFVNSDDYEYEYLLEGPELEFDGTTRWLSCSYAWGDTLLYLDVIEEYENVACLYDSKIFIQQLYPEKNLINYPVLAPLMSEAAQPLEMPNPPEGPANVDFSRQEIDTLIHNSRDYLNLQVDELIRASVEPKTLLICGSEFDNIEVLDYEVQEKIDECEKPITMIGGGGAKFKEDTEVANLSGYPIPPIVVMAFVIRCAKEDIRIIGLDSWLARVACLFGSSDKISVDPMNREIEYTGIEEFFEECWL